MHFYIGEMSVLSETLQHVHSTSRVWHGGVSLDDSATKTSVTITAQETLLLHV